jgi:hypothetical protein
MSEKKPAHVEQALAELAGTENEEQARAAHKRLDAAGYKDAAQKRGKATEDEPADGSAEPADARKAAPKGRSTRQEAKGATT